MNATPPPTTDDLVFQASATLLAAQRIVDEHDAMRDAPDAQHNAWMQRNRQRYIEADALLRRKGWR